MSEQIDWSKAPEGTIGLGHVGAGHFYAWFSDRWYEYVDSNHGGRHYFGDTCAYSEKDIVSCPPRPATTSWSGEGLPPVGVVCEVKLQEEWSLCEIIAHFQQPRAMVAAFTVAQFHGGKKLDSKIAGCFRPIRTPEQIAAELTDQAIKEIAGIICRDGAFDIDDPEVTESAVALYDAGYRKEQK